MEMGEEGVNIWFKMLLVMIIQLFIMLDHKDGYAYIFIN